MVVMFAGRYEIVGSLGSGRLGEVYRAFDHNQQQEVALKLFRGGITPSLVFREASLLTALQSDHILRVLNADVDQDVPYIATQIAKQGSAFDKVNCTRGLRSDIAVTWIRHLLRGLTACHLSRIIHRDIKPHNLFVARGDLALLGDFGLAEEMGVNGLVDVQGTPIYVAPEGHISGMLSVRSEIYSVGLTAWTLLTGQEPYSGLDEGSALEELCRAGFRERIRAHAPHVPQALALAIERAYKPDPTERYESANAMDEALGRVRLSDRRWVEVEAKDDATREWISQTRALRVQVFELCDGTQFDVRTTHIRSGRRWKEYCLTSSRNDLFRKLRKLFDQL